MTKLESIKNMFPIMFHPILQNLNEYIEDLQEIRIRVNCPCIFIMDKQEWYPDSEGTLSRNKEKGIILNERKVEEIFNHICRYSPYAYEHQLRQGFITVAGGHRVGTFGQAVMEAGKIVMMKQVRFLHVRISHEIINVARKIIPYVYEEDRFLNTLIISPPGCGKTTLLRDMVRLISNGILNKSGKQICVIDERSEIAGSYMGIPQNDIGMRTDVLDGCPKAEGILMAVRAMGPQIIVVDELGMSDDYEAIARASKSGVQILASIHGNDKNDIEHQYGNEILKENPIFERYIELYWECNQGQKIRVINNQNNILMEKGGL